jgi:hypothetical protein
MEDAVTPSVQDQTREAIAATLQSNRLCGSILSFFLKNEHAMDTASGIASCWVGCDELAARTALERLLACGVVAAFTAGGRLYYRLKRDPDMLAWLRTAHETGEWAGSYESQPMRPIEKA